DDLHAAHFRRAGDRATGKHRAQHFPGRGIGAQAAAYVAHDVVHVGVTLHHHQLVDLDAAGAADAAEVVALEVDQHHVLGALLGMADHLADALDLVVTRKPRPGAGDRP